MKLRIVFGLIILLVLSVSVENTLAIGQAPAVPKKEAAAADSAKAKLGAGAKKAKGLKKVGKLFEKIFKKKKKDAAAPAAQATSKPKDSTAQSSRLKTLKGFGKLAVDLATQWDSVHQITDVDYISASDTVNRHVFGFHPYWMGSSYESYDYDLLSSIAYFSFEIDPESGKFKDTHDWKTTEVADSAKKHGCRLYITVTNFSKSRNRTFLKSKKAKEKLIEEINTQLDLRNADGVVIDFENVPDDVRTELTQFILELSANMKEKNRTVCMTIPAVDSYGSYDVESIDHAVEHFLLMGYDYFGSWSKEAGPVAPFQSQPTWGSYSVEASVDDYLSRGVDPKQLILVVPYYGASWEVSKADFPSPQTKFNKHVLYREAKKKYGDQSLFEAISKTAYCNVESDSGKSQIWYDDERALAAKYDLVIRKELAGAGIWALGYDNGHTELWKLLEQKFGNVPMPEDSSSQIESFLGGNFSNIDWRQAILAADLLLIKITLGILSVILLLGFLLSLRKKEVRDIVFQRPVFTLIFLAIAPIISLYIILGTAHTVAGAFLLLGLLVGYGIYFLRERSSFHSNKKIP